MCAQVNLPGHRLFPDSSRKDHNEGGDTAIAAVWLVFYAVAITAAVVAPVFLRAIDIAAVH